MKFSAGRREGRGEITWIRAGKCSYINLTWARGILQHLGLQPTPLHSHSNTAGFMAGWDWKGRITACKSATQALWFCFYKINATLNPPNRTDSQLMLWNSCSIASRLTVGFCAGLSWKNSRIVNLHQKDVTYYMPAQARVLHSAKPSITSLFSFVTVSSGEGFIWHHWLWNVSRRVKMCQLSASLSGRLYANHQPSTIFTLVYAWWTWFIAYVVQSSRILCQNKFHKKS